MSLGAGQGCMKHRYVHGAVHGSREFRQQAFLGMAVGVADAVYPNAIRELSLASAAVEDMDGFQAD